MSVPVSAFLCAILWTAVLLWLAAPIGGANAIVALISGVLAGESGTKNGPPNW